MNQPYQILLDIWEGNPDLDAETLKAHGVVGLIVRLNDMNGGHHMDERFEQNWALAKQFPVQTIYFVYNPWKNGQANYDWLKAHLPANYGQRRLMVDIEVNYPGYSPKIYAIEVERFKTLVNLRFPMAIYTGHWFLSCLSRWPVDVDYWWAAYPYALKQCTTWAQYKQALEGVGFELFTRPAPAPARLWQCSGDGVRLEGFGRHAVDVNVFPGTLDELKAWMGIEEPPAAEPQPEPEPADNSLHLVVTATALNVRSGPGTHYPIVDQLKAGERVTAVDLGGADCWIEIAPGQWAAVQVGGTRFMQVPPDTEYRLNLPYVAKRD